MSRDEFRHHWDRTKIQQMGATPEQQEQIKWANFIMGTDAWIKLTIQRMGKMPIYYPYRADALKVAIVTQSQNLSLEQYEDQGLPRLSWFFLNENPEDPYAQLLRYVTEESKAPEDFLDLPSVKFLELTKKQEPPSTQSVMAAMLLEPTISSIRHFLEVQTEGQTEEVLTKDWFKYCIHYLHGLELQRVFNNNRIFLNQDQQEVMRNTLTKMASQINKDLRERVYGV